MENNIHNLPPSKRFKLLNQNQHKKHFLIQSPLPPQHLPAKKRSNSDSQLNKICLPAKKRIWAPISLSPLQNIEEEDDGIICNVCRSTDAEPNNPIVFCDGCDLMVHSSCYGNPLISSIPEGNWFCLRCKMKEEGKKFDFDCCLCPIKGGALKQLKGELKWAHIQCALLVPEVFFGDSVGREEIDCSKVPEKRWGIYCYLCEGNFGCGIECSEPNCGLCFHVSCGLEKGLSIEYKELKGGGIVAGFCEEHTQLWKKQKCTGKFKIVSREKFDPNAKIRG